MELKRIGYWKAALSMHAFSPYRMVSDDGKITHLTESAYRALVEYIEEAAKTRQENTQLKRSSGKLLGEMTTMTAAATERTEYVNLLEADNLDLKGRLEDLKKRLDVMQGENCELEAQLLAQKNGKGGCLDNRRSNVMRQNS